MSATERMPTPAEWGWVRWDWLLAMYEPDDPGAPPARLPCAVNDCRGAPATAVRRAPVPPFPAFWQPYCARHTADRGVEVTPQGLTWTRRFLAAQVMSQAAR